MSNFCTSTDKMNRSQYDDFVRRADRAERLIEKLQRQVPSLEQSQSENNSGLDVIW